MKSIRAKLLLGLLIGIIAAIAAALVSTYVIARVQAGHAFDFHLQQIAETAPDHIHTGSSPRVLDAEEFILLQIWDSDGNVLYASRSNMLVSEQRQAGFQDISALGKRWRVFVEIRGDKTIQVSQLMDERDELILQLAVSSVLPLFALIPLLALLVSIVVTRNLKPLAHLSSALASRDPHALQPVVLSPVPPEVEQVVAAVNDLIQRLDQALKAKKEFIADAAHELRTPLTALRIQTQLAESATTDAARADAFRKLFARLDRADHLIAQLLNLARQDAARNSVQLGSVELSHLVKKAVADFSAAAQAKDIDLGAECHVPAIAIQGVAADLEILLNCLIDNAVRYSFPGGKIDVVLALDDGRPTISVVDNGPGIPPQERERVFNRFYRGEGALDIGSGLGLAIAEKIAAAHGASIRIEDNDDGVGVRFLVTFPAECVSR